MKKKKGFTLIELLAVMVILAIIVLIAVPMVLKYVDNTEKGANTSSVDSLVRAANNYYAGSLLKKDTSYPVTFDLSKDEDIKKLGIKGTVPNEGTLIINEDGTTFLSARYGDVLYSKYPEENNATTNDMVVGDSTIWETDGQGAIIKYKNTIIDQAVYLSEVFYKNYILSITDYITNQDIDHSKTLKEYIINKEQTEGFSKVGLPNVLIDEIDALIDMYNDKKLPLTEDEAIAIAEDNASSIPNALIWYNILETNFDVDDISNTNAFMLIYNNIEDVNTYVIPNYVKHEDGTLEKITTVKTMLGMTGYQIGKTLIVSNGIEVIEKHAFYMGGFSQVVLPMSLKRIEDAAFGLNTLTNVILPSNLEYIGKEAFKHNVLTGEIIIPKNVTYIGTSAFSAYRWTFTEEQCNGILSELCNTIRYKNNAITKLTFAEESKINEIASSAFAGNLLTTVTIPGSITAIGSNAFECPNLKSAIIQRDKNINDGNILTNAFGSIQPTYQP